MNPAFLLDANRTRRDCRPDRAKVSVSTGHLATGHPRGAMGVDAAMHVEHYAA